MPETDYSSLAELRAELTDDNPDDRANAYGAVIGHDIQPSQVLGADPDASAVQTLVAANVIPDESGSPGRQKGDRDEELLTVLKECRDLLTAIEANTGGA